MWTFEVTLHKYTYLFSYISMKRVGFSSLETQLLNVLWLVGLVGCFLVQVVVKKKNIVKVLWDLEATKIWI